MAAREQAYRDAKPEKWMYVGLVVCFACSVFGGGLDYVSVHVVVSHSVCVDGSDISHHGYEVAVALLRHDAGADKSVDIDGHLIVAHVYGM
jgi:hypothetical protein